MEILDHCSTGKPVLGPEFYNDTYAPMHPVSAAIFYTGTGMHQCSFGCLMEPRLSGPNLIEYNFIYLHTPALSRGPASTGRINPAHGQCD